MQTYFLKHYNSNKKKHLFELFHRARHDIFVEGVGRPDLTSVHKFEYDIWDTALFNPVSVLQIDETGRATAVARLVSSMSLTMLEANHQEFMWRMHDKRDDLWEIQRLGVCPNLSPQAMERNILNLLAEITFWCLENAIRDVMLLTYSGIAEKRLDEMQLMGPERNLVGAPHVALIGQLKRQSAVEWKQRADALSKQDISKNVA